MRKPRTIDILFCLCYNNLFTYHGFANATGDRLVVVWSSHVLEVEEVLPYGIPSLYSVLPLEAP